MLRKAERFCSISFTYLERLPQLSSLDVKLLRTQAAARCSSDRSDERQWYSFERTASRLFKVQTRSSRLSELPRPDVNNVIYILKSKLHKSNLSFIPNKHYRSPVAIYFDRRHVDVLAHRFLRYTKRQRDVTVYSSYKYKISKQAFKVTKHFIILCQVFSLLIF